MSSSLSVVQELACLGQQDRVLVGPASEQGLLTYWRFVHLKHTPFAMEPVDFDATASQARFGGQNVRYTFQKQGDLVWNLYARVDLPGIVGFLDGTGSAAATALTGADAIYWTNAIGQYIIQQAKLTIGGTIVDTLYDTYLYMWEEISGKPGKRLTEMIGKFATVAEQQKFAQRPQTLYVPLPFYFTQNSGMALPLVSLQFHPVQIEITFAQRLKCVCYPPSVTTSFHVYVRPEDTLDSELDVTSLSQLKDTDLSCQMEANYIYLGEEEREKFAHGQFQQVITEVQPYHSQASAAPRDASNPYTSESPSVRANIRLQFNHVVMEYIFAVRRAVNEQVNEHFNFQGFLSQLGYTGYDAYLDPIRDVTINFNNNQRVRTRPGRFFRLVQPYQHHSWAQSTDKIHVWSYAVDPEDVQPSGGANHSRLDNVNLNLNLDPRIFNDGNSSADIFIYARNRNVLRFKNGLGSIKFAS